VEVDTIIAAMKPRMKINPAITGHFRFVSGIVSLYAPRKKLPILRNFA
jgi:hypothetical protein